MNNKILCFHISLDISKESPQALSLEWKVGDALAVLPSNSTDEVDRLFKSLSFSGEEIVIIEKEECTLFKALREKRDIKNISNTFLEIIIGVKVKNKGKEKVMQELQDLVERAPELFKNMSPQELVDNLVKLSPRYYSIASKMSESEEE